MEKWCPQAREAPFQKPDPETQGFQRSQNHRCSIKLPYYFQDYLQVLAHNLNHVFQIPLDTLLSSNQRCHLDKRKQNKTNKHKTKKNTGNKTASVLTSL